MSICWTIDIQLFDFYRKRGLGADQSHYNQSRRWSWLHTTLAQITRIAPKWITLYWKFFHSSRFWATCAFPEKKQSCPEIFHCIEYIFYYSGFLSTALALKKTELPTNFSLYWIYFLHSGVLSNLRLPWKTKGALNSNYWIYFLLFRILSNLRLPWKTELPWNFSLYLNIFYHSGFLSNLRLPWKRKLPWKFSLYMEYAFHIQNFWATCACPEKQSLP